MATLAPTDSTWFKVMENMGADWKKISGGNVNLVDPSRRRAGRRAGMRPPAAIRSIQAAGLSGAGLGDIDQGVACLQIPMMFDSYEELDYVRDRIAPKLEKASAERATWCCTGATSVGFSSSPPSRCTGWTICAS